MISSLLLAHTAGASRVAVVVDLTDQIYTKCVTVPEDTDGYQTMEETDLDIAWSYFGQSLGHGLCSMNDVGCPSADCFCDPNAYWNFYVKDANASSWAYSQVGFDGGSTCSEHYCAADGETLGFGYGGYGTQPPEYSFGDVCCSLPGDEAPCGTVTLNEVVDYIDMWAQGRAELGDVIDLIDAWSSP